MAIDENSEDEALVRAIIAGNSDACRFVVRRYANLLTGVIQRQVGDAELAQDLAQDSFLRAYNGLKDFQFEAKLSTWLVRIALNVTQSHFASRRYQEQKRSESFDLKQHDASGDDMDEQYQKKARLQKYREALASLAPKFREVLVLCALEGKSYEETATLLAVPVGTVRSRLNAARLQMKAVIASDSER